MVRKLLLSFLSWILHLIPIVCFICLLLRLADE